MLRLLLPIVFLLAGLGGGIVAGKMMSTSGSQSSTAAGDTHAAPASDGQDAAPADGHGAAADSHGPPPDPSGLYEYVRLNNQFVVPIIRHGTVRSLVVMSLTIEIESGQNEAVFSREPRLRDELLRVMFTHANVGGFDGNFTSVEAMATLRQGLREAAQQVLGEIAHDVLIVDIVRQDA